MNNLDFLNLNTVRNYPIKDGLSKVSSDGLFTIPDDLITDMSISCPGQDNLTVFISKVVNSTSSILIEVTASSLTAIGTFLIDVSTATGYKDYFLTASSDFPGAKGILTIGTIDSILLLPSGEFQFDVTSAGLCMRVYAPSTTGVNYLAFIDSKGNRAVLTGYVTIEAESNLQFRQLNSTTIALDAGEGLGLNKNCDNGQVPIKTINGVRPDSDGNFYLIPGDCITIDPAEFGVVLGNSCGKPCLGCNEIGTLTDRLVALESDLIKTRDYVTNVQGLITQLTTLVNFQCECN